MSQDGTKTTAAPEDAAESTAGPPSLWQRLDLGVILFALAIYAGGILIHRRMSVPPLIDFARDGLHFERPAGWLPGLEVAAPQAGLARFGVGTERTSSTPDAAAEYHKIFLSARDPLERLEVQIRPRPGFSNLRGALALARVARYGEFYWAGQSSEVSLGRRDWIRTHFRYAFKSSPSGSPQVATGVEYATLNDKRLFVVTFHGNEDSVLQLEDRIVPSLRITETSKEKTPL